MQIRKERLRELAKSVGISQLGVTTAEPLNYMRQRLQRRIDEGRITPFEEKDPTVRLSPEHLLAGCRSMIILAVPYAVLDPAMPVTEEGPRGLVASCARGLDYHSLVTQKAGKIIDLINRETNASIHHRILSDRSPLLERELARNAGLGWIGENCTLINNQYGSFTALGTILLDHDLEADDPLDRACQDCTLCRNVCPTGAIKEPYILNPNLCLSYLTQTSGILPRAMRPLLENMIYGCDCCQKVCPHNQSVELSPFSELSFSLFPAEPLLVPLLTITQREFDLTIGLTSAGWRGKTTLQRNTVIALGNSGNQAAVQPLTRLLENDHRSLIRLHAAWALGRLGGSKARFALEKSRQNDPEHSVKKEAALALLEGFAH